METTKQGSITKIFVVDGQYVVGGSYVLVSNEEQSSFEIEKIPLKILDKWMMKTTKVVGMGIFQSQQVKKRWKDM